MRTLATPALFLFACMLVSGCLDAPVDQPGTSAPVDAVPTPTTGMPEPTPTTSTPTSMQSQPDPLSMRTLVRASFSGIHHDTRELLRDEAAWSELWERHRADDPRPEVDMPNETVIAVVVHGPSGCAGIHLGNVTYRPDEAVVDIETVHEQAPGIQCFVAFEDVFHFAAIPSRPGSARYRDVEADTR